MIMMMMIMMMIFSSDTVLTAAHCKLEGIMALGFKVSFSKQR